jgi:BolA protein
MTSGQEETMSETQEKIRRKMIEQLEAKVVEIVDESWKHAGHAGASAGGGHFILRVVSKRFEGVSRLNRNRLVFQTLAQEMQGEIHALSVSALTPEEHAGW